MPMRKRVNKGPWMKRKTGSTIRKGIIFSVLLIVTFLVDLPLISMVGTSFKANDKVLSSTTLFPAAGEWSIENFTDVLTKTNFGRNIFNSFWISVLATLICVAAASMAGYGISRFKGKFIRAYSGLIFLMQMFPLMLLIIPMFVLYSRYGMVNKPLAVAVYYGANNLAFNIMMIRSFFDSIPRELEDAGKIGGCTNFHAFMKIILPVSLPGIATIGIMTFLNCWNEFTFASLLLRKSGAQTLTVGLTNFVQQSSSNWGYLMAASTIAVIPALIFLIFAQKYLVQGMTSGAVKG